MNLRHAARTVGGSTGFEEGFVLQADETKPCKLPRGLNRQGFRCVPRARMPARIVRQEVQINSQASCLNPSEARTGGRQEHRRAYRAFEHLGCSDLARLAICSYGQRQHAMPSRFDSICV